VPQWLSLAAPGQAAQRARKVESSSACVNASRAPYPYNFIYYLFKSEHARSAAAHKTQTQNMTKQKKRPSASALVVSHHSVTQIVNV
jgi:hypothetical protein